MKISLSFFFLFLLCSFFWRNIICDIKELNYEQFYKMLTTEKNNQKKNYILDKSINYKNFKSFQDFLYIKTNEDFVLYVYAKWDTDSNNLISIFREVDRILTEHQIKLNFYIFNIDQAKDLCNFLNITSLPLILYVSSVHKKKYNTLLYKFLNSNKDIKISNAFRYNGDMYCYDYIVEWVEAHYYFTKFILLVKKLFSWKK
ncbi:conserved Plasmodium protein, unknown function [Plasmodium sp. DRC-Itaito]|uniref:Thioredoxin domain-containing protein n=2 Tax=Plasmodium gaboni TaxID=647221 RepID=A0ABY1UR97_9APIC|nr:conserved Plasmodium protein, unknown function [Plasmodium sp. gorilla clade G2]SOV14755.1 conserved Plasmodium protein, unknown function [Plasmodium gaboni]SOV14782.1 conserved Plasmodium protein, unknown function [Plasmodium sp. gorilla clade G2]SOV22861.1 conserved Plasmodium protein, unknown function [Plasmodium sp. DRC-Itaito]